MMDTSHVKALVDANINQMVSGLCLNHWRIEIIYTGTGHDNWKAKCDRAGGDYYTATITIDPNMHDDDVDVLRSLRHELLHLHLAPFDLYRDLMTQHIEDDTPEERQEQRAFTYAVEQMVGNLERMLANVSKDEFKLLNTLKGAKP